MIHATRLQYHKSTPSESPPSSPQNIVTSAKVSQLQHLVTVTRRQVEMEKEERQATETKLKEEQESAEEMREKVKALTKEVSELQK